MEITVFPWKPKVKTEKGQHCPNLHPVYEDEEGKCYFRRQASLVQVNFADLLLLIYNYFDMSKKKKNNNNKILKHLSHIGSRPLPQTSFRNAGS